MSEIPLPELPSLPSVLPENGPLEHAEILPLSEVTGDTPMLNTPAIPKSAGEQPQGDAWYDAMIEPPVKESVKLLNSRGLNTFTSGANNSNIGPLDQNPAQIGIKIDDSEVSRLLLSRVAALQKEVAESGFKPEDFGFSVENYVDPKSPEWNGVFINVQVGPNDTVGEVSAKFELLTKYLLENSQGSIVLSETQSQVTEAMKMSELESRVKIMESIGMVEGHVSQMDMGDKTKQTFLAMMRAIHSDEKLIAITDEGKETSFKAVKGSPLESQLIIDRRMLAERIPVFVAELNKREIEITPEEAMRFVFDWNVAHELGHGLQTAYNESAEKSIRRYPDGTLYTVRSNLSTDTIKLGISEQVDHLDYATEFEDVPWIMENEGFAEGFARLIIRLELQKTKTPDDANKYLNAMQAFREVSFNRKKTVNRAGYVRPHSPELLGRILSNTKRWENVPFENRKA